MHTLTTSADLTSLLMDIEERPVVMLGEASHGTHENYTWRTAISKRLIHEKGFSFYRLEGDWPDCYKIYRYVKGHNDAGNSAEEVLRTFDRWPTWTWANREIAALAEWLCDYNKNLPREEKVGFYGLDVHSLWDNLYSMMDHLENEDPQAAESVRKAIQCFEPFHENETPYVRYSLTKHSCRDKVLAMLKEIRSKAKLLDGDREAAFSTV